MRPRKKKFELRNSFEDCHRAAISIKTHLGKSAPPKTICLPQVADQMEEWFTAPACDGFVLAATSMPGAYDDAVRLLVPELQRRGLFQKEYAGTTLRENLGLAIPRATDWHAARRKASARHL
jgi:hypothetical protein